MTAPLFPVLAGTAEPETGEALRVGAEALRYDELRTAAATVAARVAGAGRVAVWAQPSLATCVGVVGALAAGVPVVPLNPAAGVAELGHIVGDSAPRLVLAAAAAELPGPLGGLERVPVDVRERGAADLPPEPTDPQTPALVIYTSGTTGPPKGAVVPRRAIAANLDALAEAWQWSATDLLCHGLPLFHVHGLVLGVLGPLRRGGRLHHLGRFSPGGLGGALAAGATMVFAVPTMWSRIATEAAESPGLAAALRTARLLVSGSAGLPAPVFERIAGLSGQRIAERYGLTETLINTAARADGPRRPGYVGPPLPGVAVRLIEDDCSVVEGGDDATMGEVHVRGPNLFSGYLNRPEATAAVFADGWFRTGDLATRAADGSLRIVGRRATDLIKSGGYKIGAGEVEDALLAHPAVVEAAVRGMPDPDLGERVTAWVVRGGEVTAAELVDHVARALAPHKRPRVVHFVPELPRNEMGKVVKSRLE